MQISINRKLAFFVVFGFLTHPPASQAAEFSDGLVPIELVRDIAGGDVLRSLPDGFPLPGAGLPDGLQIRLIGSFDRNITKEVYIRTENDSDEVRSALVQVYVAGGWTDISSSPAGWVSGISGASGPQFYRLCHDELGTLDINGNGSENGENKIVVRHRTVSLSPFAASCGEQKAYIDAGYPSGELSLFQALMPVLEGPEESQEPPSGLQPGPFIGSFSSSASGRNYRTSQRGTLTLQGYTASALFAHFVIQLEEQGWAVEHFTNGDSASSSIWSKSAPLPEIPGIESESGELDVTGFLIILAQGEDTWLVQFEMFSG